MYYFRLDRGKENGLKKQSTFLRSDMELLLEQLHNAEKILKDGIIRANFICRELGIIEKENLK